MKEYLFNIYLKIRLWVYNRFLTFKVGNDIFTPRHVLNLKEDFKIGMPWGTVHPSYSHQVMEESSVEYINDGAVLDIVPFHGAVESGGNTYHPEVSAGCLYGKTPYRFGIFELKYTLPESDETWPAFWLFGTKSWPPEIDMFEFMPNSHKRFGKSRKMSISTHSSGEHGGHLNNHSNVVIDIEPRMTMRMEWRPDSLKFYHNELLIKQVTNKEALKQFASQDQHLVIGTGVMWDYSRLALYDKFIIHSVKYKKI